MKKDGEECGNFPALARLNYFYGQVLGPHDLRSEQTYFREKLRLHNRCLFGYGVVCGLMVEPAPQPCPDPCDKDKKEKPLVTVDCGFALDCHGDEIIVRQRTTVDLWCLLDDDAKKRCADGKQDVWLVICYKERFTDPTRPALPDACSSVSDCQWGRIEDCFELKVVTEPPCDERCETCCEPCEHACLVLARICNLQKDKPIAGYDIHNGARRMVTKYEYTTITGISWVHGAMYSHHHVQELLNKGLRIQFSKPVRTDTILDGVADFWIVQDERLSEVAILEGEIEVPQTEYTDWMIYRKKLRECLQEGDRILFTLRCAFILDKCCRPVDGLHVGGKVPFLGELSPADREALEGKPCARPRTHPGHWTSGNGTGGGTFESWIWIEEDDAEEEEQEEENETKRRGPALGGGK
jgi:hypothetical protein